MNVKQYTLAQPCVACHNVDSDNGEDHEENAAAQHSWDYHVGVKISTWGLGFGVWALQEKNK